VLIMIETQAPDEPLWVTNNREPSPVSMLLRLAQEHLALLSREGTGEEFG
jgi:hypothetical protein